MLAFDEICGVSERLLDGRVHPAAIRYDQANGSCDICIWIPDRNAATQRHLWCFRVRVPLRQHLLRFTHISDVRIDLAQGEPSNRLFSCSGLVAADPYVILTTHDGLRVSVKTDEGSSIKLSDTNELDYTNYVRLRRRRT